MRLPMMLGQQVFGFVTLKLKRKIYEI